MLQKEVIAMFINTAKKKAVYLLFLLSVFSSFSWFGICRAAYAQETAQIYLEFDPTSTKSEIRMDVVIKTDSPVGAFLCEYSYNTDFLQLKSISSLNGGEVYSHDSGGNISVIYLNSQPAGERVLTLKFKVLQQGNSTVSSYYSEVLSTENSPLSFVNNNDCEISVDSSGVTSTSKTASKTSSSSSGKVSVIKDEEIQEATVDINSGNGNSWGNEDFFSFQSDNPVFWIICGALGTAAVFLMIFTGYKMGVKNAKAQNSQDKTPDETKE